jgi:HK97 family phage prohead protease
MTAQLTDQTTARTGVGQKFRFFTGAVKAYTRKSADNTTDEKIIEGIASSNQRDRYGDTMTVSCLSSMLQQCQKLTMFGNHDYDVPECVYGKCGESTLETDGDKITMAIKMVIAESNPRAVKSWELIAKDGVTLAFSVGGIITDAEVDVENDDGSSWWPPLLINDMELLEISLCGIPANRESYTRSFLEDIKKSAFKVAMRDPGVQLAFLRSIGVKSVAGEFADLRDAETVNAEIAAKGVLLEKDGTNGDGSKTGVHCKHDPVCESFEAHVALEPEVEVPDEQCSHRCKHHRAAATIALNVELDAETKKLLDAAVAEATRIINEAKDAATATTADAQKELSAITAEIETKKAEAAALTTQRDELQTEVTKLKATPTGRQSQATPGGSSTIKPADLAKMTADELRDYRRKVNAGNSEDARPLGATEGDEATA